MKKRNAIAGGLLFILLGAALLAIQFVPGLQIWFDWPTIIIGVGIFLLIIGLATGTPEMAIPASIVSGIGGLLYWQNATGNWESWSYAWALIPGFVGIGIILSGLLSGNVREGLSEGGQLLLISLVMFLIFGSFFGALGFVGDYWPLLLIGLGLILLVRGLFSRGGKS